MNRRDSFSTSCVLILALSGCVEPQPNPAAERLMAACDAGDTQACAVILEQQQRQREGAAALGMSIGQPTPTPYVQPYASPYMTGQKVCPNGMIVSQYYLC